MAKSRKDSGPLTEEHLKQLNRILRATAETGVYCEKCKECGIDVDPEKRVNDEQQKVASAIKRVFFPNAS